MTQTLLSRHSPFRRNRHINQQDKTKDVKNAVMQIDTGFIEAVGNVHGSGESGIKKNFQDDVLPWPSLER